MITNTISFAPAWVPGTGSVVARPYACATARPIVAGVVAEVQGTGVPMAGKRRGADLADFGFQAALPTTQHDPISTTGIRTQNDGTTPLGIHSPGRPKS
jgi:hypothetical protein